MPDPIPSGAMTILAVLIAFAIVEYVRRRDDRSKQAAVIQRPGGTTTSGRILLADTTIPSTALLQSTIKELWNIDIDTIAVTKSRGDTIYSFPLGWASVIMTMKEEPLPVSAFEGISPLFSLWENAASEVHNNRMYITLDIMSEHLSTTQRCTLFTFIAATIALRTNAVAIHLPDRHLLFHPNFYIEAAIHAHSESCFPIQLWVEIAIIGTPENTINAFTRGMEKLGRKELEIQRIDGTPDLVQNILMYVAYHSISSESGLVNNEIISLSDELTISVSETGSFILGRNPVHRIELH